MAQAATLRERLHHLYYSTAADACRFRYAVLAFDGVTLLFVIVTTSGEQPSVGLASKFAMGGSKISTNALSYTSQTAS